MGGKYVIYFKIMVRILISENPRRPDGGRVALPFGGPTRNPPSARHRAMVEVLPGF